MPYLLIRHKVKDYELWKDGFEAAAHNRQHCGSKGGAVSRGEDDPHEVIVLLEWTDSHQMRTFALSEELQQRMQDAGVTDSPDFHFLNEVDKPGV